MQTFLAWLKNSIPGIIILGAVGSLVAISLLAVLKPLTKKVGRMLRKVLPERFRQVLRLLERPLLTEADWALSQGEIFTLSRVVFRALWAILWFVMMALFVLAAIIGASHSSPRLFLAVLLATAFFACIKSMRRVVAVGYLSRALGRHQRTTLLSGGRGDEETVAAGRDAKTEGAGNAGPLTLAPVVKELHPPRDLGAKALLAAAFAKPRFALVAVRNEGQRNIAGLLPEIWLSGERYSSHGMWYSDTEGRFLPLTSEGIPLGVGAERLLVLAVIFPEITRTAGGGRLWYAVSSRDSVGSYFDHVQVVANGQAVGEQASVRVRFRAEGVDQSISILLTSTPDREPAIKAEP